MEYGIDGKQEGEGRLAGLEDRDLVAKQDGAQRYADSVNEEQRMAGASSSAALRLV